MKYLLVIFLFLSGHENLFSQKTSVPSGLRIKTIALKYKEDEDDKARLPFSFLRVIDSRYDTSKIGYTRLYGLFQDTYRQVNYKNGLSSTLQQYFSDRYHLQGDQAGPGLMISVRKFWLKEGNENHGDNDDVETVYISWDMYIVKDDKYLPYKKMDTVIKGNTLDTITGMKAVLKNILRKYDFSAAINVFDQRTTKTLQEIINYNNKRFDLPILKDSILNRGVYMNFISFVQNKPDILVFKENSKKIKGDKKQFYLSDSAGTSIGKFWGYSENQKLRIGKNEIPLLVRQGNAFEYFLIRDYGKVRHTSMSSGVLNGADFQSHYIERN